MRFGASVSGMHCYLTGVCIVVQLVKTCPPLLQAWRSPLQQTRAILDERCRDGFGSVKQKPSKPVAALDHYTYVTTTRSEMQR